MIIIGLRMTATHPTSMNPNEWNHAALQLAQCYREDLGVKKDLEKAAEWYEKAIVPIDLELLGTYGDVAEKNGSDCPW